MTQQQAYKLTEEEFQRMVIEVAYAYKWMVAHFRKARTLKGWVTPVQADGKGWPDLVLVRPPRIIFSELKSEKGKLTPEQQNWMTLLKECQRVITLEPLELENGRAVMKQVRKARTLVIPEIYLWKPSDWEEIAECLR